jgi:diguanylate cyclase (GGDEF)-like protein
MAYQTSELFRIDPLTGRKNYLAFLEYLASLPPANLPDAYSNSDPQTEWPTDTSLLFIEINHMKSLNETYGHVYGDSAINWLGILLSEDSGGDVYRVGGVEFVVVLSTGTFPEHEKILQRILERLNRESEAMKMANPAVHTAVIHFPKNSYASPVSVLMQMSEAMLNLKKTPDIDYKIFMNSDLNVAVKVIRNWIAADESDASHNSRWITRRNVQQTLWMAKKFDQAQEESYTDFISGLPNLKAALLILDKTLKSASASHTSFAMLLIDGDNIRAYNNINYAAGDEMIRDMCAVFKQNVRPNDFVSRWRSGDEFMVILPETSIDNAKIMAERIRTAVKNASQTWKFPVTISIGVASYPENGDNINALIDKAETANKRAKIQGKDQVVLAI